MRREPCRPLPIPCVVLLCALLAHADRAPATAQRHSPAAAVTTLKVGRLALHRCATAAAWCARLPRALDPLGATPGTVPVYFEYYPHTADTAAAGTLVATEGGPGYPATGARAEYLALFAPLRTDHDVLIMDNRGTGRSRAIDCRELQQAAALTEANIGACGRALGAAAMLYGTAQAADDLAAILEALAVPRIDLYGNSYGSYFAQVFALRHADTLRSLVLDGAYPLDGPDYAWYPHYAPAMRDKFNLACERAPACRALGGSSLEHIAPALAQLRAAPFEARVRSGDGRLTTFTADASLLATVMFGSAPALVSVREVDAAARAFSGGDRLPLLRLMAETLAAVDSRDATHAPRNFSAGLAAAVFCGDAPQIFEMTLPPVQRIAARDRAIAERRAHAPDSYAPFTIDEYRRMPLDYAFIDECVRWPAPTRLSPALALVPAGGRYPEIPILVVSGELDNMTPVADGSAAAAHFPRSHHLVIANGLHVNALPHSRSECAATLVRRFLRELATGDESCAAAVPPVRLVPRFARHAGELDPAQGLADNRAGEAGLRAVTAALLTAGDVIARVTDDGAGTRPGLRGGRYTAARAAAGYRLALQGVRWTEDLTVSGRIDWPGRSGIVHARLTLLGAARGSLELEWPQDVADARATVRGVLDGRAVRAQASAP